MQSLSLKETSSQKEDDAYVHCKVTLSLLPNNKDSIYEV